MTAPLASAFVGTPLALRKEQEARETRIDALIESLQTDWPRDHDLLVEMAHELLRLVNERNDDQSYEEPEDDADSYAA